MSRISRRFFLKQSLCLMTIPYANILATPFVSEDKRLQLKKITIDEVNSTFEREPLARPFMFKGGALSELWQTVSYIKSTTGNHAIGSATQSVLWSDASVFSSYSESGGNAFMYALTEKALQLLKGQSYTNPIDILIKILPEVTEYGKTITANPNLRQTFVLNSLVSVDNALWLLYAKENNLTSFDEFIPEACKPALAYKHDKVASISLISYDTPKSEIIKIVEGGCFILKIKIGQSGTQSEMLEKDKARMADLHSLLKNYTTAHTKNKKLIYYLDANGRYQSKETFMQFVEYTKKIGAFDQILMIEEPFPEEMEINVSDIPVRIVADESAHTDTDVMHRIKLGYKAIALKPIAKTLSMSMLIAQKAVEHNIPCFCADLTVNPILVEWNKIVAARLKSFPEIKNMGLVESNGSLNYKEWDKLMSYHPYKEASWVTPHDGVYDLDKQYYALNGGILKEIPHYENLFKKPE